MPDAWVPPRYTAIRAFCRVSLLNPFSVLLLGNIKFFALEVMLKRSRCGMGEMLYYEINRASEEVVKSRIGSGDGREVRFFAYYSAGGFILLLYHWITEGMKGTPEQYARRVSRAVLRYIRPEQDKP